MSADDQAHIAFGGRRAALFGLVLLANLLLMSGGVGGDGYTSYLTAEAVVTRGALDLDVTPETAPATSMMPENYANGHPYRSFGRLWTVALVPFVALGYAVAPLLGSAAAMAPPLCASAATPVCTAWAAWLLAGLLEAWGVSAWRAVALGGIYAFATFAWPYAQVTFSDPFLTALLLAAVLAVTRAASAEGPRRSWWFAAAGAALGAAVLTKFYAGIFIPILAVYGAASLRRAGLSWRQAAAALWPAAAVGAAAAGIWMWSNTVQFGGPFFLDRLPAHRFQAPWEGLAGLIASPGRSLFLYAPCVILALWALPRAWRAARLETGLVVALLAALLVLFAPLRYWHGGLCWGPRYLLPIIPFLVAVVGLGWPARDRMYRRALATLAVMGLLVQLPAVAAPWFLWEDASLQAGVPQERLLWTMDGSPLAGSWIVAGTVLARQTGLPPPTPMVAGVTLDLSAADHWTSWLARLAGGSFTTASGRLIQVSVTMQALAALVLAGGMAAAGWLSWRCLRTCS